jgi:hypothetical protein
MRLYALVEVGDPEAIGVYLSRNVRSKTACAMNRNGAGLLRVESRPQRAVSAAHSGSRRQSRTFRCATVSTALVAAGI